MYKRQVLIHELCHANQGYYQNYTTKKGHWRDTPAARDLIRIVGFEQSGEYGDEWELPSNSPYREIYGGRGINASPIELGAEICALFIHPQTFLDSYTYTRQEIESVINNTQLQQWFNTYIKNTASLSVHSHLQNNSRITAQERKGGWVVPWVPLSDGGRYGLAFVLPNPQNRYNSLFERVELYESDGTLTDETLYRTNGTRYQRKEYRSDGTLRRISYYDTDGITRTRIEHYNTQGNLVRTTS